MDLAKTQKAIVQLEELLRKGYDLKTIKRDHKVSDELLSMARARIKNARDNKIDQSLIFTEDDLRFCTNQMVADYRAKRLACDTIIDVGAGIGIQAIAFAKTCKKVIAIELDKGRIERAELNARIAGITNIEFIQADAIKVLASIKSAEVIFWDPERPPAETKRATQSFSPAFDDLMAQAQRLTQKVAVELPPRLAREDVMGDPELEYVVVNHETNRLTAYFGPLKKVERSVIALPETHRISTEDAQQEIALTQGIGKYIAEIDEAVLAADLLAVLGANLPKAKLLVQDQKSYLTSDHVMEDSFLKVYKVHDIAKQAQLGHALKTLQCSKVILHGKIPERAYASWRKSLQESSKGTLTCHLFVLGDEHALTTKQ